MLKLNIAIRVPITSGNKLLTDCGVENVITHSLCKYICTIIHFMKTLN